MTATEWKSDFKITTDTLYLALTGELWGADCDDVRQNWPRYNGTALYLYLYYRALTSTCRWGYDMSEELQPAVLLVHVLISVNLCQ